MSVSAHAYRYCPNCSNALQRKLIDGRNQLFCNTCGFIFWNNPRPATSIILEKDGNVLFVKRSHEPLKDYWVLPGGVIEYDEDPSVAIRREVKEETGLDVSVGRVFTAYLIDNDPRGNSIDIVYEGSIIGGEFQLHEHSQHRFFSPNDLPDLIAYKHREVIMNWYKRG